RWVAWLSYKDKADEVIVSGAGQLHRVSGRGDHHAPAIASDGQGRVHVVYSRKEGETYQLFETVWSGRNWSKPEQLTTNGGSDLWPKLVSDGKVKLALVWQGFRNNESAILVKLWDGRHWGAEQRVSETGSSAWTPSAAFGAGKLWIAWDAYATGAYQIYVRELGSRVERVTHGENFSVRASIVTLPSGAPVVAWAESGPLWGKDFSWIIERRGTVIYKDRRIRVAYREESDWKELPAPVADAVPSGIRRYIQQPELATGDTGRLYMVFRVRTSTNTSRLDYFAAGGRWETFLTSLDGDRWTPAIPMPESVGRNSMRAAIALHDGKVNVAWATDARAWPGGRYGDLDVFSTVLDATARPANVRGGQIIVAPAVEVKTMHPNEREDVRRIRAYRYRLNGKTYRILRGDLHR
ncbi:MAG: TolB family protein, partial [Pseudomonadota bacterium]